MQDPNRGVTYWKARFGAGAAGIAVSKVSDVLMVHTVLRLLGEAAKPNWLENSMVWVLMGVLALLYGASSAVKFIGGIDRIRCAESLSRIAYPNGSATILAWSRARLVDMHHVVSTITSCAGIVAIGSYFSLTLGASFILYSGLCLAIAVYQFGSYRLYHNEALGESRATRISNAYERVHRRIVSTSYLQFWLSTAGLPLYMLILVLFATGDISAHDAIVTVMASKLLITFASSLAAPILRIGRATSQIDIALQHAAGKQEMPPETEEAVD